MKARCSKSALGPISFCQRGEGKEGFALIIALGMMAFLVLLMISLSTMIMVEFQVAGVAKQQMQASENAKMALTMAIGELQRYAGPDQRMTAQGVIVPGALGKREGWTGVWRTDVPNTGAGFDQGGPHWLVSGLANADVTDGALVDPVELLSAQQGYEAVEVGREYLVNEKGQVIGGFAFWVADEGVKARVNVLESEGLYSLKPGDPDYARRLQAGGRVAWEYLSGWSAVQESSEEDRLALPRVSSFEQAEVLHPRLKDNRQKLFHDVTFDSRGVLADSAKGGLKKDLTLLLRKGAVAPVGYKDADEVIPDGPTWGQIRSFYNIPVENDLDGGVVAAVDVRGHSETEHGIFPIPVMVDMNWGFRTSTSTFVPGLTQIEVTMQPVVVLMNPYNVSLKAANYQLLWDMSTYLPSGSGNEGRIQFSISNQPASGNDGPVHYQATVWDLLGKENPRFIFDNLDFRPGEVKVFTMDPSLSGGLYPSGGIKMQNRFLATNYVYRPTNYFITEEQYGLTYLNGRMRFITNLRLELSLDDNGSLIPLQVIENIQSNSSGHLRLVGWREVYPGVPSRVIVNRHQLVHSGRDITRVAQGAVTGDGLRWLANYNIMAPLSKKPPATLFDWSSHPLWNGLGPNKGGTFGDSISQNTPVNNPVMPTRLTHAYYGPGDGMTDAPSSESFVVLFELPRSEILSIGELQHANLAPHSWQPAYALGNSWASPHVPAGQADFAYQINEAIWDGYFFSTVELDDAGNPTGRFLNERMKPWKENPANSYAWDTSSENLAVDGAFNINSTSENAWRVLLASLNGRGLQYWDPNGNSPTVQTVNSTANLVSRFVVPAGPSGQQWRGFRELTQQQIEDLAKEIVSRIKARGPFRSLAEFINRDLSASAGSEANKVGLLQAAIDATNINAPFNSPTNDDNPGLPYPEAAVGERSTAAPGYVTQADILRMLGPMLQARSDTFLIRAYGEVRNPLSGKVEAQAWAEAIVQRVPEYVEATLDDPHVFPPSSPVNDAFGRRFVVTQFRWLNESEL